MLCSITHSIMLCSFTHFINRNLYCEFHLQGIVIFLYPLAFMNVFFNGVWGLFYFIFSFLFSICMQGHFFDVFLNCAKVLLFLYYTRCSQSHYFLVFFSVHLCPSYVKWFSKYIFVSFSTQMNTIMLHLDGGKIPCYDQECYVKININMYNHISNGLT